MIRWTKPAALLALALALGCQDEAAHMDEYLSAGEAYLEEKQWAEAILEFRNVVSLDPNHARAHHGLAKAYLGQEDARKAYWELEDVVRLDPNNVEALLQHAQFLLFGKDAEVERVLESADHALSIDPNRWEALVLKARALERLDRTDQALEIYRQASEVSGEEAKRWRRAAGRPDRARSPPSGAARRATGDQRGQRPGGGFPGRVGSGRHCLEPRSAGYVYFNDLVPSGR